MSAVADRDLRHMRRALALARQGEGLTRPNPPVGAVIVNAAGRVVGEGFHARAGGPHAEVVALLKAGERARGGTLYVTLEPCSTWGRTPPCTDAILAAGISRVVAATKDPNPRHAGRGLRRLAKGGLTVTSGVARDEADELLAPFAKWILRRVPYVTLKMAVTLDGRIADAAGRSRWITGPDARKAVHALRRTADAILVGRGTAEADDPSLCPKPARGRAPLRVVVDSRGRLPLTLRLFRDAHRDRTVLATTAACPLRVRRQLASRGVRVAVLPDARGKVSIPALLRWLGRAGCLHVLAEGGGRVAGALLAARAVDAIEWHVAPIMLGAGVPAVEGTAWRLGKGPRFALVDAGRLGADARMRLQRDKD